jgi:hypothetical protein
MLQGNMEPAIRKTGTHFDDGLTRSISQILDILSRENACRFFSGRDKCRKQYSDRQRIYRGGT